MDTFDTGGDLTVGRLGFGAMRVTGEDIVGEPDDPDVCDGAPVVDTWVEVTGLLL